MKKGIEEIKGEVLESYGNSKIINGFPYNFYELEKPDFDAKEQALAKTLLSAILGKESTEEIERYYPKASKAFVEEFNKKIIQEISIASALERFPSAALSAGLQSDLMALVRKHFPEIARVEEIVYSVLDNSIGFGAIGPLLRDSELEEIMVNSPVAPIFVFHRKRGMCKTNVSLEREEALERLIMKIARTIEKKFDAENPLLDARLPDGSRANATYKLVSPAGYSLTIRKFTEMPYSIVDLIEKETVSSELAAFLWVMVEGLNIEPMNIIVTGGSGSGKTTTLNALSTFVRYSDRVITIEDTPELDLGARENWIQLESKPETSTSNIVSMDDLLRNSLRMRPDRIVVGEVRGEEAQTLFVAMDIGHQGCMGTLHSNSAREMLLRLQAKPMNVPESMLNLLNLVLVQYKMYSKTKGPIRRIAQVAEITRMDEKVLLSNVFEWERKKDKIERTEVPSHVIEFLSEKTGMSKNELRREMLVRQRILEWMLANKIKQSNEVEQMIQQYYLDPDSILEEVLKGI